MTPRQQERQAREKLDEAVDELGQKWQWSSRTADMLPSWKRYQRARAAYARAIRRTTREGR